MNTSSVQKRDGKLTTLPTGPMLKLLQNSTAGRAMLAHTPTELCPHEDLCFHTLTELSNFAGAHNSSAINRSKEREGGSAGYGKHAHATELHTIGSRGWESYTCTHSPTSTHSQPPQPTISVPLVSYKLPKGGRNEGRKEGRKEISSEMKPGKECMNFTYVKSNTVGKSQRMYITTAQIPP